ncbi:MAG: EAL domain-containing protein [Sedimentibacter sp.]
MFTNLINTDKITQNKFYRLSVSVGILALIIFIGVFVYFTGGTSSFVHLMYIPIFLTVFLFGIKAGIIASIIAGLALGPYMPLVVNSGIMQETRSWVFRIIMFIIIVIFVGLLLRHIKSINESEKSRAYIDIITGYPNYNKFVEDLSKMILEQKNNTLSLIIFEYKNREMINQYVNHEVGKKSYIKLINTADNFFSSCNIYTVSSNKFIIIIPNQDYNHAYNVANEFADKTKQPIYVDTFPVSIIIQGGIVNFPMHGNEIKEIILKLEKVLSQASKLQKNITIYDNKLELESIKYYNTLVSLYYSLQNDMFKLEYQPKINLTNNEIVGTEALLRIKIDSYKDLSIEQLISIAEEAGFIGEITKWVIATSVKQIKEWQKSGINTKVSINLSSIDLNDDSLINYTKNCLKDYGVYPYLLEFELTERSIIKDEQNVLSMLKKIKEAGIKVSLDDYGSGHNSLSYLVNDLFPFDYIKIDKMFIDNIIEEQNKVLIQGIIETAHVLKIGVIAEGVETEEQVNILNKIGCDIIQGYYYSKPLPPENLIEYIKIHA